MMNGMGKFAGMVLGFMLGGVPGLIMGLFLGHLFDQSPMSRHFRDQFFGDKASTRVQEVFFNSTFTIMGYVAKSDGRVSEQEIQMARRVMTQMGLSEALKYEAIRLFNVGKQPHFNVKAAMTQLKQACWYRPNLLRLFLEMQIQMANAEGEPSAHKRAVLQDICRQLGVPQFNFSRFEQRYRAEQNYQRYTHDPRGSSRTHLTNAYHILGIESSASDAEVKRAYRKRMSQHHPDKLIAKGLPPEMIKVATQKTQQIKDAYEQICRARGA